MDEFTAVHGVLVSLASLVGFYGVIYRTWIAPQRRERDELIRWRAEQEAKDRAHETQMANMEARLDDGKAKFDQIMALLHDIKVDLAAHRRECEKKS